MNLKTLVGGCFLLAATTGCGLLSTSQKFSTDDLQGTWVSDCSVFRDTSYREVLRFQGDLLTFSEVEWSGNTECDGEPDDDLFTYQETFVIGDVIETEEEEIVQEITFLTIDNGGDSSGPEVGEVVFSSFSIVGNQLFFGYHEDFEDYLQEGNHPTELGWDYPYTFMADNNTLGS